MTPFEDLILFSDITKNCLYIFNLLIEYLRKTLQLIKKPLNKLICVCDNCSLNTYAAVFYGMFPHFHIPIEGNCRPQRLFRFNVSFRLLKTNLVEGEASP